MGRIAGQPNKITAEVKEKLQLLNRRFNSFFKRK